MTEIEVLLNRRYLSDEAGVSAETRSLLASEQFTDIVNFGAGEVVIAEGDDQDTLYFTLSGRFHASTDINDAHIHRRLGTIEPGQFIGEVNVIDSGGKASASVKAMDSARALRMTAESYSQFCNAHPAEALQFTKAIGRQLCERLRQQNTRVIS